MGGYEREPAPQSLDGIPADFNGKLLAGGLARFDELMTNAVVRVPSLPEMEVVRLINGPEAFTPDGLVFSAPRTCEGSGRPSASAPTASPAPAGWASSSPSGSPRATPSLTPGRWTAPLRPPLPSRDYTLARTTEVYATYYDVKYPGHERQAGRPLRVPHVRSAAGAGVPSARSRGGAGELVRAERRRERRVPAAARLGRSCGRRRSGLSIEPAARRQRFSTRRRSPRSRSRARRGGLPRAPQREPRRTRGRRDHLHADAERARRDRVRLHGHAAGRRPLPHRQRARRSDGMTSRGSSHAPDEGVTVEDVTSHFACLGLDRRRDPAAARRRAA